MLAARRQPTEAKADIVGPPIRYLTPGSTLKLMCRITQNTEASAFIFWYHDNRMINYDGDRGINVSAESGNQFIGPTHFRSSPLELRPYVAPRWQRCKLRESLAPVRAEQSS